jgi:hypothetical protein
VDENDKVVDWTDYSFPKSHPDYYGQWSDRGYHWLNDGYSDALYVTVRSKAGKNEDGTWYRPYKFHKWQDGEWQFLGEYRDPVEKIGETEDSVQFSSSNLSFYPCDNDRFISVSWSKDLENDKRPDRTPFARFSLRQGKKEVTMDSTIPFGIDGLRDHMHIPGVFEAAANARSIVNGKHATIIHPQTGLYWCFSLEKASLVKAGCIFRGLDEEEWLKYLRKRSLRMAVLCAAAEKDGTVLVSALEEVALKGAVVDTWVDQEEMEAATPDMTEKEREKAFIEQQRKSASGSKYLVWYRIHPENGRVEKLGVPPIGGAHERAGFWSKLWLGMDFWRADEWRPLPDGSVRMGLMDPKVPEQEKAKEKK